MIVSMWMTRNVVTIGPHTPVAEAAGLMALKRIRRLAVVEELASGPRLVGIVSAKDILHAYPPDVNPFGVLASVREQKLVGLITESDIFRAFVGFFVPPQRGARITFDMSTEEDVFEWIAQAARGRKLRVLSLISSQQDNLPVCVVRIAGDAVEALLEDIWNSGHRVLNVIRFSK